LGLPATGPIIFFSSRISPEKDAEAFLGAIGLLARKGQDLWVLNLSGGHGEFLASANAAGVAGRVIAADAVHPLFDLPRYYQASDLCVQASREEGLGFSPLEALACEVPVVAAAVGGLRETIVDGVTGWTYPRGDAHGLASRISEALSNPQEGLRRARNGRQMIEERFASRLAFDRLLAVIDGACRPSVQREDRE
jgi:D-inositol-3-phosphate glycosyltransferase